MQNREANIIHVDDIKTNIRLLVEAIKKRGFNLADFKKEVRNKDGILEFVDARLDYEIKFKGTILKWIKNYLAAMFVENKIKIKEAYNYIDEVLKIINKETKGYIEFSEEDIFETYLYLSNLVQSTISAQTFMNLKDAERKILAERQEENKKENRKVGFNNFIKKDNKSKGK